MSQFKRRHLYALHLQDAQAWQQGMLSDPEYGLMIEASGRAWTLRADNAIVACIGLMAIWDGRAEAWALVSKDAGPHMIGIVRAMQRILDEAPSRRVEAVVDASFKPGHRLMKLLGFHKEAAKMRAYLPSGADASLYARVKA